MKFILGRTLNEYYFYEVSRCKVVYSIQLSFDTYRYISLQKYNEHVYTAHTW